MSPYLLEISVEQPEPFDIHGFAEYVFAEHCEPVPEPRPGWRALECPEHPGFMSFRGSDILVEARSPWRSLLGNLALHGVIRLQRDVFFFHAASAGVGGRGVVLAGPREAGKTTLSAALADRGHQFLGDETAAVRAEPNEVLPFRRRLSIRPGPCAEGVRRTLDALKWPIRTLADGTLRYQIHADALFDDATSGPVPLGALVFLDERASTPRLRRVPVSSAYFGDLKPFEASFWQGGAARAGFGVVKTLGNVPWFRLRPGPIDQTIGLLEKLMEED